MTRRLVDIDDALLGAARAELGTDTIDETVNEALRRAVGTRARLVANALDVLGQRYEWVVPAGSVD